MAMSSGGDDQGMMAEINVTPFVDVMLVLLIIFMVTAPMMTTGMDVELPRTDAPPLPIDQENDPLILSITAEGTYAINDRSFTFEELQTKIKAIAAANPDQDVFLRADGGVPYEKVARLMALCTQAGIARMGMVTQPGALTDDPSVDPSADPSFGGGN
ncbi:MAG: protein TolR [Myxococcota bacterium]